MAQIGVPLGQPLNAEIGSIGLFLWIGFFAVAAIGYGNLGHPECDKGSY